MKQLISFFEIPASDFGRAVHFYEKVFELKINVCDCGPEEIMGFFPDPEVGPRGAIILAKGFGPAQGGILISFTIENLDSTLERVVQSGGGVHIPKTRIEAEGQGWFAVFTDSEGNRVGLHQHHE